MNVKFSILRKVSQTALVILLTGMATLSANISYADQTNPQVLLEKVTNTTFQRIESEQQDIQSNPNHLKGIIEQELMPHIDHQFAAFKVLGNQFRAVPKKQIPEYVAEFKQYLISNFATALASYGGQQLIFEPVKNVENLKNLTIKAIIREAGHPDINLHFKLRKNNKTQEWKTYDLVAEGISLLSSKRTEFASVIRQQGIQAVIDIMKDKNNQPLELAANAN
ncbi:ABC transporter substrate-binding protein [Paraglaciecola aquimarina]|uniref:ABC transporter substrate-binding protein n=1 Tax=Paraglaciecola algarum TaxID=3050085 RepID=A0ABS9DC96_9ALTE|nr:ABC transporter substrate-binding protein [Paraglaciecola sp. G1-23]MCF2949419.1 ABC transporter substrate-binding protein [Paraglaciecola sp. G1-23]